MARFFVVGDTTVDQMYFIENLPEIGREVIATRASLEPGGAGGTVAIALAHLDHEVKIATRVGQTVFAEYSLQNLRAANIDTSLVQVDEHLQTSNVTLLITPDARRTMVSSPGASRNLNVDQLEAEEVKSCDAVVISAYSLIGGLQQEYTAKVLEIAKENHLTIFIDMGSGVVNALHEDFISLITDVDYLLMNEQELFALTNEETISDAVVWLASQGIKRVLVKVGAFGSIVITPEVTELVEALELDDIVDSTGAGDYYTAAFAHGIMQGYDLKHAARLGNVAGALNATMIGAQSYKLSGKELERYAKKAKSKA